MFLDTCFYVSTPHRYSHSERFSIISVVTREKSRVCYIHVTYDTSRAK